MLFNGSCSRGLLACFLAWPRGIFTYDQNTTIRLREAEDHAKIQLVSDADSETSAQLNKPTSLRNDIEKVQSRIPAGHETS